MNIPFPSDSDVQKSITQVCEQGLPQHTSIISFIRHMTRNLGIKRIFEGVYDAVVIAFSLQMIIAVGLAYRLTTDSCGAESLSIAIFSFSPVFFIFLYLLIAWKEREHCSYEIKMTCRYTVNHLLAYRMLLTSVGGILFISGYTILLCRFFYAPVLKMMALAYSSLFLFSVVFIKSIIVFSGLVPATVLSVVWILGNILLATFCENQYALFLDAIPFGVLALIDVILVVWTWVCTNQYLRRVCYACS